MKSPNISKMALTYFIGLMHLFGPGEASRPYLNESGKEALTGRQQEGEGGGQEAKQCDR